MSELNTNYIVTDQTYLYDFSYKKRVDLVAKFFYPELNYKIIVFGFKDKSKEIIVNDYYIDLTSHTFNKLFSFFKSAIFCAKFISKLNCNLIVENLFSTIPLFISRNNNFHFDLHGEVVDEFRILKSTPRFVSWFLYQYEGLILLKSKSISVCSKNHKKSIEYRLALKCQSKKITVLPNVTNSNTNVNVTNFKDLFFENFLKNNICLVYSGSALLWQNPEKIINFFKDLSNYNPEYRLLILTKDLSDFRKILINNVDVSKDKVFITECEHENINYYYSKCSFGIVFRDFSRTNFVSSPTKVIEYAKNNLGILYSGFIGDFIDDNYDNCGLIQCDKYNIENIENKMKSYLSSIKKEFIYPLALETND